MNITEKKLIDFTEGELNYWDFSGVIRILKKGSILFEASRGYSNLELGIKNHMRTRFSAASVTKQFTAFAIMLLYDRNLLTTDQKANACLPPDMQIPPDITVQDLLSHTSGLYNFYNFEDNFFVGDDRQPYNRQRFFQHWISKEPVKQRGIAFDYNNSNYNLLAWIIEHLSGQSYSDFVSSHIFEPLGMKHSSFDDGQTLIPEKAGNYMRDYGKLVHPPYTNPLFHTGAGGLVTNCDDLQTWYECLRNRKLLSKDAYRLYFQENLNHYCCGLERYSKNGSSGYFHGGDYPGVSSYTQYLFDDDLCIILLSNIESLNQYRFADAITAILYGKIPKAGRRPQEIPLSQEEHERFIGTYLPGKIHIEAGRGKLYLVRVNQNIHIECYCIGENAFVRRFEEQQTPHILLAKGASNPSVWGYERIGKEPFNHFSPAK